MHMLQIIFFDEKLTKTGGHDKNFDF